VEENDIQVQEAQRAPNKMHHVRVTPRYIIINMVKCSDKEDFKSSKRKQLYAKENPQGYQLIF